MSKLRKVGWGTKPDQIEEKVKQALESYRIPIVKGKETTHYITFEKIEFERDNKTGSSGYIKESITFEKSILTRIYGDVVQYEGSKRKVLVKRLQIGQLPQLIEGRNTFMITGSEYNIINQPRRKPSVFVYSGSGGSGTAVADFNLSKGRNFSLEVDPVSGYVVMIIGGSSIPLRPLLESVGMTREDLRGVTDDEFVRDHWDDMTPSGLINAYRKLYSKLFEFKQEDVRSKSIEEIKPACVDYFKQTAVDPKTTKYLFAESYSKVDKNFLKTIISDFFKVNTGEKQGVDPDDLYYQKLYPADMLFKDRLERTQGEVANAVRNKLKLGHEPERIFRNVFSKYLVSMINSSDLSRLDPQYNPIGIYTASTRVSPLGMGGIGDIHSVTKAKRGVHASYFGLIDPSASAQGQNVGVQMNLTDDVEIDDDGEIYLPMNNYAGKTEKVLLAELYDKKILLPESKRDTEKYVMHRGRVQTLKSGQKYDYALPKGTGSIFNSVNQLVSFPQAVQGNRSFMTARQITQALPLKYGEAPYVEPVDQNGVSTYRKVRKELESLMPMESPYAGTVTKAKDGEISIKDDTGKTQKFNYHEHLPFATNTGLHQTPIVKAGDKVKKGQMLVKDGYTTEDGKLALGKNLKFAFTPYYGLNTLDGTVISESAAKKLTSLHYYTFNTKIDDTKILDKKKFMNMMGPKYPDLNFDKYNEKGVLIKNEQVFSGEPVILIIEKRTPDDRLSTLGKISNKVILDLVDSSILYEGVVAGEAVESHTTPKFASVTVMTEEPAVVGDKVTGMYGNKTTISKIIPDDQILQDESGEPIDMIYSSTTVVSRMNPGQIYENALGKIVKKKGLNSYKVPVAQNPTKDTLADFTMKEMKKHKIMDKEKLFNPVTGKHIERKVAVGEMYMIKLLKGDKDLTARGVGPGYSSAGTPSKGGKEGAKAIGAAEFNALVGHNARAVLTDVGNIKGQKNNEYWKRLEMGMADPVNPQSEVWNKAKSMLTAAGGYVTQNNSHVQMLPLTDKITNQLAGHRTIETPALLNSKNLEPMKKGLFDPAVTGGASGTLWSKLELEDGIISPLTEDYLRLTMGKTKEEMKKWQTENTAKQMVQDLDKIDINAKIKELKDKSKIKDLTNSEIKILRFLSNMKDRGESLKDLVITKIPVPPPIHRPITKLEGGGIQISDLNLYYKDIMTANEALKGVKGTMFAPESKAVLLDNVKALVGTEETHNIQLKKKGTRGILPYLGGVGSPKNGFIHSTLVKKNQDLSGRSRIVADASMSMDEIGIPEQMAWKIFEPHTIKELRKTGVSPVEAGKQVREQTPLAKKALESVAGKMLVMGNRAPTLHRFGILAFKPKLVPGTSIHLNLPAANPFNADFDGDAIQIHVPSNEKVSRSLDRMLLSKNVFSDVAPGALTVNFHEETILGLYQMSEENPKKFKEDIESIIGKGYKIITPMRKKEALDLLREVARKDRDNIAEVYDKLRKLGETYATDIGSTVGVEDVTPMIAERDKIVNKYKRKIESTVDKKEKAYLLQAAQNEARAASLKHKGELTLLAKSGAKGNDMQLSGILVSPMLAYDPDNPLDTAEFTPGSYAEGLNMKDFWLQNMKVKKDAIATALNVAVPGSLGKLVTYNTMKEVISMEDCGTKAGVKFDWNSSDICGRVLQEDLPGLKKGIIISNDIQAKLPKRKILVRAPRTCAATEGVCSKCFGSDSFWNLYEVGTHVGVRASQAIIEPIAQKALDSKHGGRDITRDVGAGGVKELTDLFSSDTSKATVAMLSDQDDTVKAVDVRKGTTHLVTMESGKKYRLHPESNIIVKPGDKVKAAQPLSEGVIPYTLVTRIKGVKAGRESLIESLKKLAGKDSINERLFDVVAKGAVNHVEVQSAFDSYLPGDTITYNKLLDIGLRKGLPTKVSDIIAGSVLAEEVGDLSAGIVLSQSDIDDYLAKSDKKTVLIFPEDVRLQPSVKSFYTSGMLEDNWVENLAQKYIKKTIEKAAAEGKSSPTDSLSPVPAWITGRPFKETGPKF